MKSVQNMLAPGSGEDIIDLLVVIVNFRTPDLTIQCLASLEDQVRDVPATRVVVTDNQSGDDSVARIARAIAERGWGGWCKLVPLKRNGGFAYGNNQGIAAGPQARYILLLNSDTIVHAGCFRRCLEVMDADATIGAMTCKLLNADGSVQNCTRKFPTPLRVLLTMTGLPWKLPGVFAFADMDDPSWDRAATARDVEWIGGAFLFARGTLTRELGGLDEDFFFYGEDIVFSHKVRAAGLRRRYDPATTTTHLGGSSSDPSRMSKLARSTHYWRGRYLVQRKCHGILAEWLVRGIDVATHLARACWHALRSGPRSDKFSYHREVLRTILRRLGPAA